MLTAREPDRDHVEARGRAMAASRASSPMRPATGAPARSFPRRAFVAALPAPAWAGAAVMLVPALAGAHGVAGEHPDGGVTAALADWPTLLAAIALAISALLHGLAWRRGAALRPRHAVAFVAGWSSIVIALLSPLDRAADASFAMHVIQHELLMVVAPPLLILSRPFAALSATLPAAWLRVVAWPLRLSPATAWALHAIALWIWHVPRFFGLALASPGWHAVQHASFFFTAMLFWWVVFRRVRGGTAALYVLTTMMQMGALAALLTFAPAPLYGSALDDQQLGGLIMWVPAGYALLFAGVVAFDRLWRRVPA